MAKMTAWILTVPTGVGSAECRVVLVGSADQPHHECADCHLQAVVSAISDWIVAWDPDWEPVEPKRDPVALIPAWFKPHNESILVNLICTTRMHLNRPQEWHAYAQHGLRYQLVHLCACMERAARLSAKQSKERQEVELPWYFDTLDTASRFC